jgi:hypothetical protein
MRSPFLWDITQCSSVKITKFSGKYLASAYYLINADLLLDLLFDSEDGGEIFFRNIY